MIWPDSLKDIEMDIKISNDKSVGEIQREFSAAFPYLKVEFFKKKESDVRSKGQLIPEKTILGLIRPIDQSPELDINPDRTVHDLERDFLEKHGLSVQIFRKSGNLWIETTLTDSWSLGRQNKEGEQMS